MKTIRYSFPITKSALQKFYMVDGLNLDAISKKICRSRQCIARWMDRWGLKRRSSMDACKLKRKQLGKLRGPNWQGGRWYVKQLKTWFVYAPYHPKCRHNGGVEEHILIAENRIGRSLHKKEIVHHLNADRNDNSEENLCVMYRNEHQILHILLGKVGIHLLKQQKYEVVLSNILDETLHDFVYKVYVLRTPSVSGLLRRNNK